MNGISDKSTLRVSAVIIIISMTLALLWFQESMYPIVYLGLTILTNIIPHALFKKTTTIHSFFYYFKNVMVLNGSVALPVTIALMWNQPSLFVSNILVPFFFALLFSTLTAYVQRVGHIEKPSQRSMNQADANSTPLYQLPDVLMQPPLNHKNRTAATEYLPTVGRLRTSVLTKFFIAILVIIMILLPLHDELWQYGLPYYFW